MSGEDGDFRRDFAALSDVRTSTLTRIFAFGVFADDDPVEVTGAAILEWGGGASEDFCGAYIGVLLERLADRKAEAPQGDVIWYVCAVCQ